MITRREYCHNKLQSAVGEDYLERLRGEGTVSINRVKISDGWKQLLAKEAKVVFSKGAPIRKGAFQVIKWGSLLLFVGALASLAASGQPLISGVTAAGAGVAGLGAHGLLSREESRTRKAVLRIDWLLRSRREDRSTATDIQTGWGVSYKRALRLARNGLGSSCDHPALPLATAFFGIH